MSAWTACSSFEAVAGCAAGLRWGSFTGLLLGASDIQAFLKNLNWAIQNFPFSLKILTANYLGGAWRRTFCVPIVNILKLSNLSLFFFNFFFPKLAFSYLYLCCSPLFTSLCFPAVLWLRQLRGRKCCISLTGTPCWLNSCNLLWEGTARQSW